MNEELIELSKYRSLSSECRDALHTLNDNLLKELKSIRAEIIKPRRKGLLAVSVLCFVYAGLMFLCAMAFMFAGVVELTENNTTEFTATISKIQPIPYGIQTEEHNAVLTIYMGSSVIDMDSLSMLTVGQTITFRVRKNDAVVMDRLTESIEIVSLKTGGTNMITLESYNEQLSGDSAGDIIFFILGGIFLLIAILCLVKYKRKNFAVKETDAGTGIGFSY